MMPIYFLRHGESEANERNEFAGHQDSPLTRLGIEQARQAGRAIARKRLVFDEIHVSPLQRARFTAQIISEGSGNTAATIHVSDALLERHFGFLQGQNKSLWKKILGHRRYHDMLHSPYSAPPEGETWEDLYLRVRYYYERVLLPRSRQGRTILVVAHKYIVEMFAHIIARVIPEDTCDLKVPNSRPSSESDLRSMVAHVPKSVNTLGELLEIHLPLLMLGGATLGVLVKLITDWPLSPTAFQVGVIICLFVSTFFGLLYADPAHLTGMISELKATRWTLLLRVFLGMGLLIFGPSVPAQMIGIFFLLPPSTLVPTLALLWGQDYAAALRITLSLSVLSPLLLGTSVILGGSLTFSLAEGGKQAFSFPIQFSALLPLAGALGLPAFVAQCYRLKQPIKAGTLSTRWGWIGGAASLPLAFLMTFYFTPPSLIEHAMTPEGLRLAGITLLLMTGAFAGLLCIAQLIKVRGRKDVTGHALQLAASTPNVFLWSALIPGQLAHDPTLGLGMLVIWAAMLFFTGLVFKERLCVYQGRENIVLPQVSLSWFEVTAKFASVPRVTVSTSSRSEQGREHGSSR
jgi:broad specificity phosphatase PhoE